MEFIRQRVMSLGHSTLAASWKSWAKWLAALVITIICLLWLMHQFERRQQNRAAAAQQLYEQLQQRIDAGPAVNAHPSSTKTEISAYIADIERFTHTLHTDFQSTPYAQMSSLVAAQALYVYQKVDEASQQLKWAMQYGKSPEYQQIARRRLAMLLFEQKRYDEGLKLLEVSVLPAFMPLYEELRGDFFKAQNKISQARQAYQKAYDARGAEDPAARFIQIKLEALGSA